MSDSDIDHKRYLGLFGKKIQDLNWEEVQEIWKNNEESLEHWKTYWQSRGFNSWQEWREKSFRRFAIKDLSWTLMETWKSASWVPHLSYANFNGWNKLARADKYDSFYNLARNEDLGSYEPLVRLVNDFPKETTIIGIELDGVLYVIEGMHRCASAALALRQHKTLETNIKIAIGKKIGDKPKYLKARIQDPIKAELFTRLGI